MDVRMEGLGTCSLFDDPFPASLVAFQSEKRLVHLQRNTNPSKKGSVAGNTRNSAWSSTSRAILLP
jgi:hypothetical protein